MAYARHAWIILWKDLATERRRKETLNALLFFSLLLLVLFEFAMGADRERLRAALPGLLWLGFVLSGLLALGRSFLVERENDCWEGLLMSAADKSAIYVGKLAGNVVVMTLVETLVLGLFGIFFNVDVWSLLGELAIVLLLGTIGLAAIGTTISAVTAHVRARELVFPVLLLPLQMPLLIGTVKATEAVLGNFGLASALDWLKLLAAADVVYVVAGVITFEFILEA
jgi:heme exporter protein B